MVTRPFLLSCLVASLLVSGCASHRYRIGAGGVHFFLRRNSAQRVDLCSSLDAFRPHAASRTTGGLWEVVLPSGRSFSYFYLVDGDAFVPDCKLMEDDGFGAKNCLFDPEV